MVAQVVKWDKRRNKELLKIGLLCLYSVFRGKRSPHTAPSPFLNLNCASLRTWITHNPKLQQKCKKQILLLKKSKLPWGEMLHISLCTHAGMPWQKCPLFRHCIWTNCSFLSPVVHQGSTGRASTPPEAPLQTAVQPSLYLCLSQWPS